MSGNLEIFEEHTLNFVWFLLLFQFRFRILGKTMTEGGVTKFTRLIKSIKNLFSLFKRWLNPAAATSLQSLLLVISKEQRY
ncbi:unnamed protein product [Lactuca virosa]|uniref:Uncharacterized protein n=1 Tax=Lactuca virosa TaxID=75947 RepID=A0AAU9PV14_9ASTR|nr:unnamed protein product [Lactuca virosa]